MNIKTNTASKLSNRKTTACVVSTSYGYVTYHMNTLIIVNMLCLPLEMRMPNICFHVRPSSVWIIRIWLFDFYIYFNIMTLLINMELSPNLSFRFFIISRNEFKSYPSYACKSITVPAFGQFMLSQMQQGL